MARHLDDYCIHLMSGLYNITYLYGHSTVLKSVLKFVIRRSWKTFYLVCSLWLCVLLAEAFNPVLKSPACDSAVPSGPPFPVNRL